MSLIFTRSYEVSIPEPFDVVVGSDEFDNTDPQSGQNYYMIKVLGGFTRMRAGFVVEASIDGEEEDLAAFYWVKIGIFSSNVPQIIPIPNWANRWRYALQFIPPKYPCEAPNLRIYC